MYEPSGPKVCTASADGTVKIFDPRDDLLGDAVSTIEEVHAAGNVCQALWRSSTEILSCGDDCCIKRWDIRKTNEPISNYLGHTSMVKAIAMTSDGRFLASGATDGSIRVWLADEKAAIEEVRTKLSKEVKQLEKDHAEMEKQFETGDVDPIVFRDTAKRLRDVSEDLEYYEAMKQERAGMGCTQAKLSLSGHRTPIEVLSWRGGTRIASGSTDQTVQLFETDPTQLSALELWG